MRCRASVEAGQPVQTMILALLDDRRLNLIEWRRERRAIIYKSSNLELPNPTIARATIDTDHLHMRVIRTILNLTESQDSNLL